MNQIRPPRSARRAHRPALFALALAAVACSVDRQPVAEVEQRPGDIPERRLQAETWRKTVLVGGQPHDSALISPFRLAASSEGLSLVDFYPRQVRRYDHSGRLQWEYGAQGGGPGEFRQPLDMKVDSEGRAWVLDPANARITVVSPSGATERTIPLGRIGGDPHEMVPLSDDRALLVLSRPERPFVVIDSLGAVVSAQEFPSPRFAGMHYLATQLVTGNDPASGAWVAAYRMGDGFFAFDRQSPLPWRGWFVEEVPFPEVITTRTGGHRSTRHRDRPVSAARSVALSPEHIYVLFGGVSGQRSRIVDRYSLRAGEYERSYLLPEKVLEIAWYDGGLYAIQDDPYPELSRLELRDGERLP